LEAFLATYLPRLDKLKTPIIVNISGFSLDDYTLMASAMPEDSCIAAVEVNISCPNIKQGGLAFGTDPRSAEEVLRVTRKNTKLPLIAKLTPNVTDIVTLAKAVENGGADMISLINTLLGMRIDLKTRKPILGNTMGGLSGPAVLPVAVRMVYQVYKAVRVPIIGMGGISTWQDAVEFMLAGATAVSIGTANFVNPLAPLEIIEGLTEYCRQAGFAAVRELVGLAHR
jgi:dihydroorotate dehydrogenase (NAD+) catalytic subunit